jgi:hypothetical protein
MIKKISNFFSRFFYGLGFGMKSAESEMLLSKNSSNSESSYVQQIKEQNVGKDLLKGEVTQEVEDLRYSTYKVYKESNNYEYLGNGVAVKKETKDFNINNFSFVQRNKIFCKGVYESFDETKDGDADKFTLMIVYETSPRFKIERFTECLTVRGINGVVNVTFRFNKDYDLSSPLSRMFYNELMKLKTSDKNNHIFSDNLNSICFTTYKAQGEDDFVMYVIKNLQPKEYEFFDKYINVTFTSHEFVRQDLIEKFFSQNQQDKYSLNMAKEKNISLFTQEKKYRCSECGSEMNQFDYEITSYDFGKGLCLKCLEKYLTLDK